jgi:flagellar L-ring protein precursor FlgH
MKKVILAAVACFAVSFTLTGDDQSAPNTTTPTSTNSTSTGTSASSGTTGTTTSTASASTSASTGTTAAITASTNTGTTGTTSAVTSTSSTGTSSTTSSSSATSSPSGSGNSKNNKKKQKDKPPSPLDQYIKEASVPQASNGQVPNNGSIWFPAARLSNLSSDLRSRNVDDVVTILVSESASAVSTGQSKTSRASQASAAVTSLAGPKAPTGALANLLNSNTSTAIDGEGTTSRQTTLTTTISARVTHVLVNGNLVVEGTRNLNVNSENQVITIRGVIRPIDLDTTNSVPSARLANMELQVNGKGIVNDSVRRPNILYRIVMGLLPF